MKNFSAKKIIACLCAFLASAIIVGGLVFGGNIVVNKVLKSGLVGNKGNVNTDKVSQESSVVTEIPDIVKNAPLPGEDFDSMVELYETCSKSCVSIVCTVEYEYDYGFYQDTYEGTSLGSGFVVEGEKDGVKGFYIITNHHVVEDAKDIQVKFYDEDETHKATLVGSDATTDIAVLTIEKKDLIPIEMGDSDSLKVGQWVVAIGSPMDIELEGTMTYGIISGLDRELSVQGESGSVAKKMRVIQTSAEINPGNSGGPLINMSGQVIGINTMKSSDYESLGFALPSSKAVDVINQIIVNGKVIDRDNSFVTSAAQLGITGVTVSDEVRSVYKLPKDAPGGVFIITVNRGTAVYEAGLSVYDIITEFDGQKVTSIEQLKELISKHSAGDSVSMTYYHTSVQPGQAGNYVSCTIVLDGVAS